MSWIHITNLDFLPGISKRVAQSSTPYDPDNEPRYLTNSEILEILSDLIYTSGADELSRELANYQKIIKLAEELRLQKFCPQAIPRIREEIALHQRKARVPAGLPAGIIAASAVSAGATQSNLNSFHRSGTARDATSSVRIMEEMLYLPKNRRNPGATIFMTKKITNIIEAMQYERIFVETTVDDLIKKDENGIKKVDILSVNEVEQYWWVNLQNLMYYGGLVFRSNPEYVCRIYFDVDILHRRQITLETIRSKINTKLMSEQFDSTADPSYRIYHGSMNDVVDGSIIMDIYFNHDEESYKLALEKIGGTGITRSYAEMYYLYNHMLPIILKVHVSGIPNIKKLYPTEALSWGTVLEEIKAQPHYFPVAGPELQALIPRMWLIGYSSGRMNKIGLKRSDLQTLFTLFNYKVYTIDDEYFYVYSEPDSLLDPEITPGKIIGEGVQKFVQKEQTYFSNSFENDVYGYEIELEPLTATEQEILNYGRIIYLETAGTNLKEIYKIRGVDRQRTRSNDVYEMGDLYGIETMRNIINKELYDVTFGGNTYVDPRHIEIISDVLTHQGVPLGIDYSGAVRSGKRGFFSVALLERAATVFTGAALSNKREGTNNFNTAIATGSVIPHGTGSVIVETDEEEILRLREKIDLSAARAALEAVDSNVIGLRGKPVDVSKLNPSQVRELSSRLPAIGPGRGSVGTKSSPVISPLLIEALKSLAIPLDRQAVPKINITTIPSGMETVLSEGDYSMDFSLVLPKFLGRKLPSIFKEWGFEDHEPKAEAEPFALFISKNA